MSFVGGSKPRTYWSVLKTRLKKEGSQLATNCSQLKMKAADNKFYLTGVAGTARRETEKELGRSIVSPENFLPKVLTPPKRNKQ